MTARDPQPGKTGARLAGLQCCILGATGFLGTNLAGALCDGGASVRGFGLDASAGPGLDPRMEFIAGDFACQETLADVVCGQDVVYHLVSTSLPANSNRDPAGDLADNVLASVRLLDICRRQGVGKVVFASSGGTVYGVPDTVPIPESAPTHPITAYGVAKLAIEKYLHLYRHLYGLDYRVLRISNPYGPHQPFGTGQGLVATAIHRLLRRQPVEVWGDGSIVRDYIHVDDVTSAFIAAIACPESPRLMNIGSGVGRSVNQLIADVKANIAEPGLPETVYYPGRRVDVPANVLDISLARSQTGWNPTVAWHQGLRDTIAWIRRAEGDMDTAPIKSRVAR